MSLARSLTSSMALLAAGRVLSILIALATIAVLTRALGPEEFGYFRTAVAYLSLAMLIGGLGLNTIVVRELSRPKADQPRILGNALALRLSLSSTAVAGGCLLAWLLPLDPDARRCIMIGSFGFVCYAGHMMLLGFFQQRLRQAGAVLAEIVGALVLLGAVLLLARIGAPVTYFVLGQALAFAAMLAVSWIAAWRIQRFRPRADLPYWRTILGRAAPLAGVDTLNLFYARTDTPLLALWGTSADVGLYGVASKIYDTCLGLSMLFVGLLGPILGRRAHVDPVGFREFLAAGWGLLMAGAVGVALMLWSFAPEFVTIIAGSTFSDSAGALRVFSLLIVIGPTRVLFRDVAAMLDLQHRLIAGSIVGAVVGLAAYALLIPRFGAVGAATALLLAELAVCAQAAIVLSSAGGTRLSFRAPLLAIGCGLAGALAIEVMRRLGLAWPAALVLGGLGYAALLVATGIVRPREWLLVLRGQTRSEPKAGAP
ncbi:MAG: oligosaccharide flippase family protein [Geminicoccaceae bacterium]